MIDSSSARTGVALLDGPLVRAEQDRESGRGLALAALVAEVVPDLSLLTAVAIATGPGSFTGLRSGASYGIGLALGLQLPLLGLRTLELAAARALQPVIGVAEAGRGRVYYEPPGGPPGLTEAAGLPRSWPAVGWLRQTTAEALAAAGVRLLEEAELRSFGEAAGTLIEGAPKLAYDRVSLEYMQSFGPVR